MKAHYFLAVLLILFITGCNTTATREGPDSWESAVDSWSTHEDVAAWLSGNFRFDRGRQDVIQSRLRDQGPSGLLVREPENLYARPRGFCADSANFARESLNAIDPEYGAQWVFVENARGRPNHWVTAFRQEGNLYIMDYGAGPKWSAMNGVHGPYRNLGEYRDFLASLNLPDFGVGRVAYRSMPGTYD
ncbi:MULTISPECIES: hypothetical protein [unclassified Thioalkalivibrio]|uniref:hypothetical protein n=1 Tax=unclassified Thioalkalivibrio TaxID=2621013 RepID=UPI000364BE15|nr:MULTISPECIES: hypothetical protein [unclassified Thioalkalivibrio]